MLQRMTECPFVKLNNIRQCVLIIRKVDPFENRRKITRLFFSLTEPISKKIFLFFIYFVPIAFFLDMYELF